jgi:hypothetical protein
MTIEKLLGMSADELDKLTEVELKAYFAPYLNITRPERKISISTVQQNKNAVVMSKLKQAGLSEFADILGIKPKTK